MKNNTVVAACGGNYFWGALLLASSMRRNGMDEPLLVFQNGFTPVMRANLERLGDVRVVEAPFSKRNMTCRKPEAMLLAQTEYITWADCDGFFVGNCSDKLTLPDPEAIHVRLRNMADNRKVFENAKLYAPGDERGPVPARILGQWQKDVGERSVPALSSCVTACFVGLHSKRRDFLERWRDQMAKVLPDENVGVTGVERNAYYQLDESVLNSLLFFMENAPKPGEFQLNKDIQHCYRHLIGIPKPWQCWSPPTLRLYQEIMDTVAWTVEHIGIDLPLPFAWKRQYAFWHRSLSFYAYSYRVRTKLRRMFR